MHQGPSLDLVAALTWLNILLESILEASKSDSRAPCLSPDDDSRPGGGVEDERIGMPVSGQYAP
jgi:hypothetical protein